MKNPIKIEWAGMSGFGPAAWDRDTHTLNMHTPLPEKEEHHLVNPHHVEHQKAKIAKDTEQIHLSLLDAKNTD